MLLLLSTAVLAAEPDVLEVEVVTSSTEATVVGPSLTMESVRTLPGALGDPVRALQGQAGIGRSPYGLAVMLVRGLGPAHQEAWLGEVRLPRALHFGGLGSIVDPALLSEVRVVHGGGPARYGGLGGAVVLVPDAELHRVWAAEGSVDLLSARAVVFQPLPFDTELAVAVRRSWLDVALQPFIGDRLGATRLPFAEDGAIRLQQDTAGGHWWQATVLGALDRLTTTDGDETVEAFESWLVRALVQTRHDAGAWEVRTGWSVGPEARVGQGTLPVDLPVSGLPLPGPGTVARERRVDATGRGVADGSVGRLHVQVGVEAAVGTLAFQALEDDSSELDRLSTRSAAVFGETSAELGPLTPVAGLRVDGAGADRWGAVTADPRAGLALRAGRRSRLVATAGTTHQAPSPRQVSGASGASGLLPERAVHASLSAEQGVGSSLVRVTAFASVLDQLVVGRDDLYRFDDPVLPGPRDTGPWRNDGEGRVQGVETAVTLRDRHTELWLSATLLRSERRSDVDPWHPWDWDQPWTLGAVVSRELGPVRIGSRLRAGAGLPYTPVINRAVAVESGGSLPVYGAVDEVERLAPYVAADVRVDWTHELRRGEVGVFAEVQNVTARANEEVVAFSDRWSQVTPVLGLPVLPTVGVRGAL